MNKSRLPAFLLFFFVTFLSVCLASIFARHNNTLLKSGRWYSEKAALPYSVLGSQAFMLSRKALAENDVDLATWHGYQEIISNPEFTADA
ncbi:MAG: hypothetical protein K0R29_2942, partial [Pseudobdellovibrio sp.]|nr:hypothetical protein [Pseudobdellovibrio sp.]